MGNVEEMGENARYILQDLWRWDGRVSITVSDGHLQGDVGPREEFYGRYRGSVQWPSHRYGSYLVWKSEGMKQDWPKAGVVTSFSFPSAL